MSTTSTAVVSSTAKDLARDTAQFASKIESLVTKPDPISRQPANQSTITTPVPSPGSFRHPRLTEIISRQSQSSFTDRNLRKATINLGGFVLTLSLNSLIYASVNAFLAAANVPDAATRTSQLINILRLFFLANIIQAFRPVIPYLSTKDEISDIPLTPSQRSLLGLNPSITSSVTSSAAGSNIGYVTPPRYRRFSSSASPLQYTSNTNQATDRRSISATYYSSSPISSTTSNRHDFSPSPLPNQSPYFNTSIRSSSSNPLTTNRTSFPFSPSTIPNTNTKLNHNNSPTASPLFHKALAQQKQQYSTALANVTQDLDFSASTAPFLASPSPNTGLARTQSLRERKRYESDDRDVDGSGSKTQQKLTSGRLSGINYKWLYDKSVNAATAAGAGLSRNESMGF